MNFRSLDFHRRRFDRNLRRLGGHFARSAGHASDNSRLAQINLWCLKINCWRRNFNLRHLCSHLRSGSDAFQFSDTGLRGNKLTVACLQLRFEIRKTNLILHALPAGI